MRVEFFVPGRPAPKGSYRAFIQGGRAKITNDLKTTKPWQRRVRNVARTHLESGQLEGEVGVVLDFAFSRAKSHWTTKGKLSASGRKMPFPKTDVDKLARAVLDGLTSIAFADDSQVMLLTASKRFISLGEREGCFVEVFTLTETQETLDGYADRDRRHAGTLDSPGSNSWH